MCFSIACIKINDFVDAPKCRDCDNVKKKSVKGIKLTMSKPW